MKISKGRISQPIRAIFYGEPGVGKTTLCSYAPNPIFMPLEDGTGELDIERFEGITTWQDVKDNLSQLANEPHDYKTLVMDTLDMAEQFCFAHVCKAAGVSNIAEMEFGKGFAAAAAEFRSMLSLLETIYTKRKMHIILIGHTKVVKHSDPSVGAEWERHELKLRSDTADLLVNWAKLVAFCAHETFAMQKKKTDKIRGVSTGKRVMFCEPQATFLAKNRYSLPAKLPLDWNELYNAINSPDVAVEMASLRAEAAEKLPMVPEARRAQAKAYMLDASRTLPELKQGMNLINSLMVEPATDTAGAAAETMTNGAAVTQTTTQTTQPVGQA